MSNIFSDFISDASTEEEPAEEIYLTGQGELFEGSDKTGRVKKDTGKTTGKDKKGEDKDKKIDPVYEALKQKSTHAQLYKHIQVEELNHLKIENERVEFLKSAGRVAEFSFMDFLYFGYMEKSNLDMIKMIRKLKHRWTPLMNEELLTRLIDMLTKEVSNVIRGVKEKQKEEIENWKNDRD